MTRKKVVKRKVEAVFDPEKRKEFLTGFRKRKNERKKRAKDQLERNIKEERKRIRQEIKDGTKHMKKSFEPLRELTEQDKANADEYEDDDVKVKIVELTTNDLTAQRYLLGANQEAESEDEVSEVEDDPDDNQQRDINCIPGMDLHVKAKKRKGTTPQADVDLDLDGGKKEQNLCKKAKSQTEATDNIELKTKKELDRFKKNKTLKKLKQSKVFKLKERFDKKTNQKKAKRERNNTLKSLPKSLRKKKKFEPSRYHKGRLLNKKQLQKKQRPSN